MARFFPLLLGPLIDAPDRQSAELIAAQRHGREYVRVISYLDLEQDRAERQAGNRMRRREEEE